jgi:hypothetical protein
VVVDLVKIEKGLGNQTIAKAPGGVIDQPSH